MVDQNVWDNGKWATVDKASYDFMTHYIFEHMLSRFSFHDKKILEFGCGTGRLSYLALKAGAAHVTLVDSSHKAVALAQNLFSKENPESFRIIYSDIFEFSASDHYDLVFSSGLIEHFKDADRAKIIEKHTELSASDCIIIHPTDTLYSSIFNKLPQAIKLYGFQLSFSEEEMKLCLAPITRVVSFSHTKFHPFYTVPLLHNQEAINRLLDRIGYGKHFGGLTLTRVTLKAQKS